MYHQSTIFIKEDLLVLLMDAVDILKIKKSRLIEALLIKYMDENRIMEKEWEMQRYQRIDNGVSCKRICVFWRQDIYERGFEARRLFKMSISYIIAEAIEKYLDELINEMHGNSITYNYNVFYSIHRKEYPHTNINITIWGAPEPEILEKILLL